MDRKMIVIDRNVLGLESVVSDDAIRRDLQNIHIMQTDSGYTAEASDGRYFVRIRKKTEHEKPAWMSEMTTNSNSEIIDDVLVNGKEFSRFLRGAKAKKSVQDSGKIALTKSGNRVSAISADTVTKFETNGNYPSVDKAMPEIDETDTSLHVDARILRNALEAFCAIHPEKKEKVIVKMTITSDSEIYLQSYENSLGQTVDAIVMPLSV